MRLPTEIKQKETPWQRKEENNQKGNGATLEASESPDDPEGPEAPEGHEASETFSGLESILHRQALKQKPAKRREEGSNTGVPLWKQKTFTGTPPLTPSTATTAAATAMTQHSTPAQEARLQKGSESTGSSSHPRPWLKTTDSSDENSEVSEAVQKLADAVTKDLSWVNKIRSKIEKQEQAAAKTDPNLNLGEGNETQQKQQHQDQIQQQSKQRTVMGGSPQILPPAYPAAASKKPKPRSGSPYLQFSQKQLSKTNQSPLKERIARFESPTRDSRYKPGDKGPRVLLIRSESPVGEKQEKPTLTKDASLSDGSGKSTHSQGIPKLNQNQSAGNQKQSNNSPANEVQQNTIKKPKNPMPFKRRSSRYKSPLSERIARYESPVRGGAPQFEPASKSSSKDCERVDIGDLGKSLGLKSNEAAFSSEKQQQQSCQLKSSAFKNIPSQFQPSLQEDDPFSPSPLKNMSSRHESPLKERIARYESPARQRSLSISSSSTDRIDLTKLDKSQGPRKNGGGTKRKDKEQYKETISQNTLPLTSSEEAIQFSESERPPRQSQSPITVQDRKMLIKAGAVSSMKRVLVHGSGRADSPSNISNDGSPPSSSRSPPPPPPPPPPPVPPPPPPGTPSASRWDASASGKKRSQSLYQVSQTQQNENLRRTKSLTLISDDAHVFENYDDDDNREAANIQIRTECLPPSSKMESSTRWDVNEDVSARGKKRSQSLYQVPQTQQNENLRRTKSLAFIPDDTPVIENDDDGDDMEATNIQIRTEGLPPPLKPPSSARRDLSESGQKRSQSLYQVPQTQQNENIRRTKSLAFISVETPVIENDDDDDDREATNALSRAEEIPQPPKPPSSARLDVSDGGKNRSQSLYQVPQTQQNEIMRRTKSLAFIPNNSPVTTVNEEDDDDKRETISNENRAAAQLTSNIQRDEQVETSASRPNSNGFLSRATTPVQNRDPSSPMTSHFQRRDQSSPARQPPSPSSYVTADVDSDRKPAALEYMDVQVVTPDTKIVRHERTDHANNDDEKKRSATPNRYFASPASPDNAISTEGSRSLSIIGNNYSIQQQQPNKPDLQADVAKGTFGKQSGEKSANYIMNNIKQPGKPPIPKKDITSREMRQQKQKPSDSSETRTSSWKNLGRKEPDGDKQHDHPASEVERAKPGDKLSHYDRIQQTGTLSTMKRGHSLHFQLGRGKSLTVVDASREHSASNDFPESRTRNSISLGGRNETGKNYVGASSATLHPKSLELGGTLNNSKASPSFDGKNEPRDSFFKSSQKPILEKRNVSLLSDCPSDEEANDLTDDPASGILYSRRMPLSKKTLTSNAYKEVLKRHDKEFDALFPRQNEYPTVHNTSHIRSSRDMGLNSAAFPSLPSCRVHTNDDMFLNNSAERERGKSEYITPRELRSRRLARELELNKKKPAMRQDRNLIYYEDFPKSSSWEIEAVPRNEMQAVVEDMGKQVKATLEDMTLVVKESVTKSEHLQVGPNARAKSATPASPSNEVDQMFDNMKAKVKALIGDMAEEVNSKRPTQKIMSIVESMAKLKALVDDMNKDFKFIVEGIDTQPQSVFLGGVQSRLVDSTNIPDSPFQNTIKQIPPSEIYNSSDTSKADPLVGKEPYFIFGLNSRITKSGKDPPISKSTDSGGATKIGNGKEDPPILEYEYSQSGKHLFQQQETANNHLIEKLKNLVKNGNTKPRKADPEAQKLSPSTPSSKSIRPKSDFPINSMIEGKCNKNDPDPQTARSAQYVANESTLPRKYIGGEIGANSPQIDPEPQSPSIVFKSPSSVGIEPEATRMKNSSNEYNAAASKIRKKNEEDHVTLKQGKPSSVRCLPDNTKFNSRSDYNGYFEKVAAGINDSEIESFKGVENPSEAIAKEIGSNHIDNMDLDRKERLQRESISDTTKFTPYQKVKIISVDSNDVDSRSAFVEFSPIKESNDHVEVTEPSSIYSVYDRNMPKAILDQNENLFDDSEPTSIMSNKKFTSSRDLVGDAGKVEYFERKFRPERTSLSASKAKTETVNPLRVESKIYIPEPGRKDPNIKAAPLTHVNSTVGKRGTYETEEIKTAHPKWDEQTGEIASNKANVYSENISRNTAAMKSSRAKAIKTVAGLMGGEAKGITEWADLEKPLTEYIRRMLGLDSEKFNGGEEDKSEKTRIHSNRARAGKEKSEAVKAVLGLMGGNADGVNDWAELEDPFSKYIERMSQLPHIRKNTRSTVKRGKDRVQVVADRVKQSVDPKRPIRKLRVRVPKGSLRNHHVGLIPTGDIFRADPEAILNSQVKKETKHREGKGQREHGRVQLQDETQLNEAHPPKLDRRINTETLQGLPQKHYEGGIGREVHTKPIPRINRARSENNLNSPKQAAVVDSNFMLPDNEHEWMSDAIARDGRFYSEHHATGMQPLYIPFSEPSKQDPPQINLTKFNPKHVEYEAPRGDPDGFESAGLRPFVNVNAFMKAIPIETKKDPAGELYDQSATIRGGNITQPQADPASQQGRIRDMQYAQQENPFGAQHQPRAIYGQVKDYEEWKQYKSQGVTGASRPNSSNEARVRYQKQGNHDFDELSTIKQSNVRPHLLPGARRVLPTSFGKYENLSKNLRERQEPAYGVTTKGFGSTAAGPNDRNFDGASGKVKQTKEGTASALQFLSQKRPPSPPSTPSSVGESVSTTVSDIENMLAVCDQLDELYGM